MTPREEQVADLEEVRYVKIRQSQMPLTESELDMLYGEYRAHQETGE